ncbi:ATP-binding protein [Klebsiella sp. BIGb0407]|uniref:ATP-binding protein n=1 Tax=Klebsiella sp. BIGb0407 TaxID=2940603 RepID=UPI0021679DDD|nr:transporter substrate-binding domain-containing protein [Klebsiella sp. BIGb0407]MCS3432231.1 two-component system sensor histidine kinase EvgS [Klebsiella sp. BIGb0407]
MIKIVLFILTILTTTVCLSSAQAMAFDKLELISQQNFPPVPVILTEDDKQWLKRKNTLHIGVYPQTHSPVVESMFTGQYRGINADYLTVIERSLGIKVEVINFGNQENAIKALNNGELDSVLTGLEYPVQISPSIISSVTVAHSWPNLVANISNIMSPLASKEKVRVSTVGDYPGSEFIYESFPNAEVIHYKDYETALNAISSGEDNYFIGDSLTTSIWLAQEYRNTLVTLKYWNQPQKKSVFLFSEKQLRLQNIFNNTLNSIDKGIHSLIAHSAIDIGDLSFLLEPVKFTTGEKQWLSQNKKIRVIVNPWYIPFTLMDSEQEIRGISGDVLNLISLQTGLTFESVIVNSYEEMVDEINKGGWHIMVPAIYDDNSNIFSYTQPFVITQFVSVVNKEQHSNAALIPGMRVAITDEHPLQSALKKQYPNIEWIPVKNASIALNLLASNKVDAAIANRLVARYLSEHYYPDQLIWQTVPGAIPAAHSIAVAPDQPELKAILDKTRNTIPQREIFQIVSKWLRMPGYNIDTWELYNKPFYLVALLATLLVVSSIIWVIYLTKEIRKRKRSQRLLVKEKLKAQRASKENREFLSRMSHEIRTPVSAIIGYLELLQNASANFKSEDKVSVNQATQASHSLLKLIGEILDLEKVESGIIEVTPTWGKINDLITTKVALFHAVTSKKGIAVDYISTLPPSQMVFLDFQLLGQVLNNIIGNAVKFTQQGSINISVSLQDKTLIIVVTDTGAGISKNVQSHIFEAFIQADNQSAEQGSGLGLTICKVLMTKMDGTISLESEVNKGTTLTITLPTETITDDNLEAVPAITLPTSVDSQLRILIADDQPASRLLLQRQLGILGIESDGAADGQEVLSLLSQSPYDVLITDINMPVMDGINLAKTIREHNTSLIIYGLTATAQMHERERCLAAGMNDCFFKPINISQLNFLLSEIKPQDYPCFDIKRLTVLTQGNRLLMLNALKDAQQENYNDLSNAHQALAGSDYQAMKYHIHRIHGTALLLGAKDLACQALLLEDKLQGYEPDSGIDSDNDFLAMLEHIRQLLAELDLAVEDFKP